MGHVSLPSPVGPLTVWAEAGAITRLDWESRPDSPQGAAVLETARNQLQDYFAGTRQVFDLPLAPRGSAFQQDFYAALSAIPFGETPSSVARSP